ncbi:solute carrier family 36 (proton-coupled amino acid transporter) protein [Dioscorea alata]|uniref:Solute carrier family 36 (Proton-coupled amino acid transporter) protein n=1 Tax=Dioscorea alata TaxID=55571 RepID=A0ACB7WN78_DIOAL|nr:solute carrier family 36 (proton-coupled amino acid transporter) protein [Dioscorea alata]
MNMREEASAAGEPLLAVAPASRRVGSATWAQTLGNIVVSVVGTGMLGLPYAFRIAGSLGVAIAGLTTLYCMILLIECREKLEEINGSVHIQSYGDLGAEAFGRTGRYLTELLVLVAQAGGAVAYLIFIGQNLSSLLNDTSKHPISPVIFIFLLLLPLEIALSFIRSLSTLAPFSALADACNILAMAIVIKEDFQLFNSFSTRKAFGEVWGLPFTAGVAVFCFEGFSMTLPLEASMTNRRQFRWVLSLAFTGITLAYILFGIFGYLAYGDDTKDIITLNLPQNWSSVAVKVGLCVALLFTFPIMMHPIHDIMESRLKSSGWFQKVSYNVRCAECVGLYGARIIMVMLLATVASFIPGFGSFVSFVGSTLCALLSFVLPAAFHLTFMGSSLNIWRRTLDYCILLVGMVFAGHGTYAAISGH